VILSVRRLTSSSIDIATSFCLCSLCGWNKGRLNYLIISALSDAEMEKLEDLLRAQTDSRASRWRLCGFME
jgi:hypothetical protein